MMKPSIVNGKGRVEGGGCGWLGYLLLAVTVLSTIWCLALQPQFDVTTNFVSILDSLQKHFDDGIVTTTRTTRTTKSSTWTIPMSDETHLRQQIQGKRRKRQGKFQNNRKENQRHSHVQPTLLSLVDPITGEYIRVSERYALYDYWVNQQQQQQEQEQQQDGIKNFLSNSIFNRYRNEYKHEDEKDDNIFGTSSSPLPLDLSLDKTILDRPRESLTVSWEAINYTIHPEKDWLALYCSSAAMTSSSSTTTTQPTTTSVQVMEVATIAEAVATNQRHRFSSFLKPSLDGSASETSPSRYRRASSTDSSPGANNGGDDVDASSSSSSSSSSWYIPKFPLTRWDACIFVLYQPPTGSKQGVEDEYGFSSPKDVRNDDPTSYSGLVPTAMSPILWLQSGDDITTMTATETTSALTTPTSPYVATGRRMAETPTNIHLTMGDDPSTSMVIQFSSSELFTKKDPKKDLQAGFGTPVAMYGKGKNSSPNSMVIKGTTTTYTASDMCGSPANETTSDTHRQRYKLGRFISPGNLHTVVFTNLQPDTIYTYKVGVTNGQGIVWRKNIYSFKTQPQPGTAPGSSRRSIGKSSELPDDTSSTTTSDDIVTDSSPYTFIVYGDQGCPSVGWGQGGYWTAQMVGKEKYNNNNNDDDDDDDDDHYIRSIHHIGDISYARGAAHIWDDWFGMIEEGFSTRIPLMIAVGNHEYDHTAGGANGKDPSGVINDHGYMPSWGNFGDDSGGECGVPTAKHFKMPQSSISSGTATTTSSTAGIMTKKSDKKVTDTFDSNGVFWYSYNAGLVHTTVISSEHDLSSTSVQYQWLEADLANVNRTITPWLIVELHRPLYMAETIWNENTVGIALRHNIEHLLRQYSVDLVLSGHYHAYSRSCTGLYESTCNNGGPVHITVGTAGAVLDDVSTYPNHWTDMHIIQTYGYGRVSVYNHTSMYFEFVQAGPPDDNNNNSSNTGKVLDSTWIIRQQGKKQTNK